MYIKTSKVLKLYNATFYVPLTIAQQPLSGYVTETGTYNFDVKIHGSRPFIYNWYKDSVPIAYGNSETLTITNASSSDTATYYCVVNNNEFTIRTEPVNLGVISYLNIVTQPVSAKAASGNTVNFSMSVVDPTYNVPENYLNYSWYKDDKLLYTSSSNSFYLFNVQYSNEGEYYGIANNLLNSVTSNRVQLLLYRPVQVVTNPPEFVNVVGKTLNTYLSCTGSMPITARWRKDGQFIGNQRITETGKITLTIPNLQISNNGYYDCVLSNIVSTVTSKNFIVYVF